MKNTKIVKKKTNFDLIVRFMQTDSGCDMLPYESSALKNLVTVYCLPLSSVFSPFLPLPLDGQFDNCF